MEKQFMRLLCWAPIIGMFAEAIHVETYRENYLSNIKNPTRYFFSTLWHVCWIVSVFVVPFFIQ